jgi:SAM-dependent methyltransferase
VSSSSTSAVRPPPRTFASATTQLFRHGNYDPLPGYEPGGGGSRGDVDDAAAWRDARVAACDLDWFRGAAVLDVGCSAGYVAIQIAERCAVRSVLGVDIDGALILRARELLAARAAMLANCGAAPPALPLPPPPPAPLPLSMAPSADIAAHTDTRHNGSAAADSVASSPSAAAAPAASVDAFVPLSVRQHWGARLPTSAAAIGRAAGAAGRTPSAGFPGTVAFRREDFVMEGVVGHAPESYDVILWYVVPPAALCCRHEIPAVLAVGARRLMLPAMLRCPSPPASHHPANAAA